MTIEEPRPAGWRSAARRLWPAAALIVVVTALAVFGPDNKAVLETLRAHREAAVALVADNAVAAAAVFMAIYATAIAFSVPGGAMMTIVGGFLFGPVEATLYVVFAATVGATALFLVARTAVGDRLRARAGPWMRRMEAGFGENAMNYLLVLRLIPLFPFFVVNLVPAFLGVSLRTYVIATFFGIIPGTFVYALAGSGLGSVLEAGRAFDVSSVLTADVIAALIGLAALALAPVVYKRLRRRRGGDLGSPEGAGRKG